MHPDDIARVFAEHREPGFGTLSVEELTQVDAVIAEERPRSFVEIGTASGLSAGMIARMLDDHGGERLVTVDLSPTFFADASRETGFVIPKVYPGGADARVEVVRRTETTAVDLVGGDERFDLALVDAGHVHPWPLLDTLCVGAVLDGRRTVLQHDLTLFRRQGNGRAVGPKILFDQFPESHRTRYAANNGNLWSVSLDLPTEQLVEMSLDALFMPWTIKQRIPEQTVEKLAAAFGGTYGEKLRDGFLQAAAFFNKPHARYFRPQRHQQKTP